MNWNDRNGGNDFEIFQILGDYDPNWYVLDGLKPPANWQDPADSATFANALGRVSATALTHAKKGNLYEISVANMTIFNHWQLHHLAIKNNWDAKFSGSWLGINSTGSQHDMFAAFDCEVESEDINPNEEVWLSGPKVSQTITRRMRKFAKACHDHFIACFPRFDNCR